MLQLQDVGTYGLLFFTLQPALKDGDQNLEGSGTDRRSQQMTAVRRELAVRSNAVDVERGLAILPGNASRKASHFQILQFLLLEGFFLRIEKTKPGMQKPQPAELRGRDLLGKGKLFQR